ncbi:hypothetical protein ABT095_04990 [Kitasatospora sp. NPDC002227]|uniref:hypothetical protein n=1 Tax=Kitasatospora sp. NPDC002227 TaxID=3154773 RepID=UPI00332BE48A
MRTFVSRALTAAALAGTTALVAAPTAQAVQIRPAAVTASMSCFAEPINNSLGSVTCTINATGVAPFSASWFPSGYYQIVAAGPSELDLTCNRSGANVSVTAIVYDYAGTRTTVSDSVACLTGTPR